MSTTNRFYREQLFSHDDPLQRYLQLAARRSYRCQAKKILSPQDELLPTESMPCLLDYCVALPNILSLDFVHIVQRGMRR